MANVRMGIEQTWRPPFRDMQGRFAKANKGLLESKRTQTRDLGRHLVDLLQQEAPKRSGEFARNIRFRTFVQAAAVGFRVTMPEPLATFISLGTRAHKIVAKNVRALSFRVGLIGGLVGGFGEMGTKIVVKSVNHPGTKANKFIGKAKRRWNPRARVAGQKIARRWIETVRGKAVIKHV